MRDREQIVASIREIIEDAWPHRFADGNLPNDVSLGEAGLGLDSVEVVEVVTACEDRFGRTAAPTLFDETPLTIDRVADHFALKDE